MVQLTPQLRMLSAKHKESALMEYHFHFRNAPEGPEPAPFCFSNMTLKKALNLNDARDVAKGTADMPLMGAHSILIESGDASFREVWIKQGSVWTQEDA